MPTRMLKQLLSPAMIVALLALAVALGGTSYAAVKIGRNSVGSAQIKNGQVKTPDLADHAVTAQKLTGALNAGQPTLASGQSMTGYWTVGGSAGAYTGQGITFPKRLPSTFVSSHVEYLTGSTTSTHCAGAGQAARGWACFYEGQVFHEDICCIYDDDYNSYAISPTGAKVYWYDNDATSPGYSSGTWTVTAP